MGFSVPRRSKVWRVESDLRAPVGAELAPYLDDDGYPADPWGGPQLGFGCGGSEDVSARVRSWHLLTEEGARVSQAGGWDGRSLADPADIEPPRTEWERWRDGGDR